MKYLAALNNINRSDLLPYGIDIWSPETKVMSFSWDDSGNCEVNKFKAGTWEASLKGLAEIEQSRPMEYLK